jgi:hypothetical protein
LDQKRLQNIHKIFKRSDTPEKLRAALRSDAWPEIPTGGDLKQFVFHGFVRRVLQCKDRSYYVETKDIDQATYDHEKGWFGFTASKCNVRDSRLKFRYLYEPYVPGRIVEIRHFVFNADKVRLGGHPYNLPITIGIERWA